MPRKLIQPPGRRRPTHALTALLALATAVPCIAAESFAEQTLGKLEYDGRSDFSHIRIRRSGTIRSLLFVRDGGEEVLETQMDLRRPEQLRFEYLRYLFASYLFRERQERVLIVGLGGGSMVHFLQSIDPTIRIDAVEIDPLVIQLAADYFGTKPSEKVNIVAADGLQYIAQAEDRTYDVIYMDAFLKPSAATDDTGAPLALRTRQFYEQLQQKLKPGGVVAFNLNPRPELAADVRGIAEAFPQTYVFPMSRFQGAAAIASTEAERLEPTTLLGRGRELNRRFRTSVDFQDMAQRLQR